MQLFAVLNGPYKSNYVASGLEKTKHEGINVSLMFSARNAGRKAKQLNTPL